MAHVLNLRLQYAALFVAVGVFLPYFPVWLAARGFSTAEIGALVAAQIAVRVVASPLAGAVADRTGRRSLILALLALTASAAALALAAAGDRRVIAVAALAMAAAMGPLIPISEGEAVHLARRHGAHYGRLRLWGSAAFVAANLGAGWFIDRFGVGLLMIPLALAHLASAGTSAMLPADHARRDGEGGPAPGPGVIRTMIAIPGFALFLAAGGLAVASHAAFYAFSALSWKAQGYDAFTIGLLWAIGVVAEIALFFRLATPAGVREATLLIAAGAAGAMARWAAMAGSPPLAVLAALQCLHAASFAMVHIGAMSWIRAMVPASMRSLAQTLYAAVSGGAFMFAATMLAGRLYGPDPAAMFLAMAGLAALAFCFALALRRRALSAP
jgi:PPP family 3-phenylpropionic acid transporter